MRNLLFVDTETGGLDYHVNKLLEIGAVLYDESGKEVDSFHTFFSPFDDSPGSKCNLTALKLNNFYPRYLEWRASKEEKDLVAQTQAEHFARWCLKIAASHNPILVGQNLPFDKDYISEFMDHHGFAGWGDLFGYHRMDTSGIAAFLNFAGVTKTERVSLKNLADYFKVTNDGAHTALADARTTAKVFFKMLGRVKELNAKAIPDNSKL